ncbi:uncharacterized protein J8A68_002217 [[Candida] subhashii]|uniref:Inner centromere protein ARK-binding domain-containing protein n=1 Tax=[Candida] subhashii TaxID=561895 RepID=A0A8J5UJ59_9ASCO|nr:uncharacterized protein J8A68_002217 [[Candida] subhashii]KAG7664248.1 hypothetical protein J8A68_002217 [[Candida] subhashii]
MSTSSLWAANAVRKNKKNKEISVPGGTQWVLNESYSNFLAILTPTEDHHYDTVNHLDSLNIFMNNVLKHRVDTNKLIPTPTTTIRTSELLRRSPSIAKPQPSSKSTSPTRFGFHPRIKQQQQVREQQQQVREQQQQVREQQQQVREQQQQQQQKVSIDTAFTSVKSSPTVRRITSPVKSAQVQVEDQHNAISHPKSDKIVSILEVEAEQRRDSIGSDDSFLAIKRGIRKSTAISTFDPIKFDEPEEEEKSIGQTSYISKKSDAPYSSNSEKEKSQILKTPRSFISLPTREPLVPKSAVQKVNKVKSNALRVMEKLDMASSREFSFEERAATTNNRFEIRDRFKISPVKLSFNTYSSSSSEPKIPWIPFTQREAAAQSPEKLSNLPADPVAEAGIKDDTTPEKNVPNGSVNKHADDKEEIPKKRERILHFSTDDENMKEEHSAIKFWDGAKSPQWRKETTFSENKSPSLNLETSVSEHRSPILKPDTSPASPKWKIQSPEAIWSTVDRLRALSPVKLPPSFTAKSPIKSRKSPLRTTTTARTLSPEMLDRLNRTSPIRKITKPKSVKGSEVTTTTRNRFLTTTLNANNPQWINRHKVKNPSPIKNRADWENAGNEGDLGKVKKVVPPPPPPLRLELKAIPTLKKKSIMEHQPRAGERVKLAVDQHQYGIKRKSEHVSENQIVRTGHTSVSSIERVGNKDSRITSSHAMSREHATASAPSSSASASHIATIASKSTTIRRPLEAVLPPAPSLHKPMRTKTGNAVPLPDAARGIFNSETNPAKRRKVNHPTPPAISPIRAKPRSRSTILVSTPPGKKVTPENLPEVLSDDEHSPNRDRNILKPWARSPELQRLMENVNGRMDPGLVFDKGPPVLDLVAIFKNSRDSRKWSNKHT